MSDPGNKSPSSFSEEQIEQASQWVARHERGLSEEETRAFERWLSENPINEACFFEHQVAWASFDVMDEWKPAYISPPNPDLFESKPKSMWRKFAPYGRLAAAVLLGFFLLQISLQKTGDAEMFVATIYRSQTNEKHFLDDGSSFQAGDKTFKASGEMGLRDIRIAEAVYKSAAKGGVSVEV